MILYPIFDYFCSLNQFIQMKQATKSVKFLQTSAFLWIMLFMFFQGGVGIHIHQCQHCGFHKTEICTENHENHDCHNCHQCFIVLKFSNYLPTESGPTIPILFENTLHTSQHINLELTLSDIRPDFAEVKGEPPAVAGNGRFLHFCQHLLFYA